MALLAGRAGHADTIATDGGHPAEHRGPRCAARCPGSQGQAPQSFPRLRNGDDFLESFPSRRRGELEPFILVVEGSIPDEKNKAEGYWATFGTDPATGQPITTCDWIDRLAPHAWAVVAVGTCAAYGGIHAMEGNPTGCMGLPDYLGWDWKSAVGHSDRLRARLPDRSPTT